MFKLRRVPIQVLIDNRTSWLGSWLCAISRRTSEEVKTGLVSYAIFEALEIIALEALLEE